MESTHAGDRKQQTPQSICRKRGFYGERRLRQTVSRQYNRLLDQCKVHMDRFENEYPAPRRTSRHC